MVQGGAVVTMLPPYLFKNGVWHRGDGAKQRMRTDNALTSAQCELARQHHTPGNHERQYAVYPTWEEAEKDISEMPHQCRHVNEVITMGRPCKPYLDLDGPSFPQGTKSIEDICNRAEDLITTIFKDDYNITLSPSDFIWMTSPKQPKVSIHLTISTKNPQYIYHTNNKKDPKGAFHLAKRLYTLDPCCVGSMVDLDVYSTDREMRICGSTKAEKTHSILQPLRPNVSLCDAAITWLASNTQVIDVPLSMPITVKLHKRQLNSVKECKTPPKHDESGETAAYSPEDIASMLHLLRANLHPTAYVRHCQGFDKCIKCDYYNRSEPCYTGECHETQNLRCFLNASGDVYAQCFAERCASHPPFKLGNIRSTCDDSLETAAHVNLKFLERRVKSKGAKQLTLEELWLPKTTQNSGNGDDVETTRSLHIFNDLVDKWIEGTSPPVLSLRSGMGTGKTTLLDNLILEFPHATILVATYRQSLAIEQERKLRNHGFVNYMNIKGDLSERQEVGKLILQIESFERLRPFPGALPNGFDFVIIDEIESVVRHFASPTVTSPAATMDCFTSLLKQAKRVLTMDAFWGDASYQLLDKVGLKNTLIINDHPPIQRTFAVTNNYSDWISKIIQDLRDDKNVILVDMSAENIYQVEKAILQADVINAHDILTHTSKTGDEIKKQLIDVDALWSNHRFVAYSPTISAGVDFSTDHFDRMYLYMCNQSCTPLGTMQMTGRVRKLRCLTIECCLAPRMSMATCNTNYAPVTPEEQHTFLTWTNEKLREVCVQYTDQNVEDSKAPHKLPEQGPLLSALSYAKADEYNARFQFFKDFCELATQAGHKVNVTQRVKPPPLPKGERDTSIQASKLLTAPDLSDDDYDDVVTRIYTNSASEEDKWAYYKHCYKEGWGIDIVTKEFVEKHKTLTRSPHVSQLMRMLLPVHHFVDPDNPDVSVEGQNALNRAKLINDVIEALGLRSPFDTETVITDLMDIWEKKLKHTDMFKNYEDNKLLFNNRNKSKAEWTQQSIVKALSPVFGYIGLSLDIETKKVGRKGSQKNERKYAINPDQVATMIELCALKLRNKDYTIVNQHAHDLLSKCLLVQYGHLVISDAPASICEFLDDYE
jgi:hypothetical protein